MACIYRVIKDEHGTYSIREVGYKKSGEIVNYTAAPEAPDGQTRDDLIENMFQFAEAFKLAVLEEKRVCGKWELVEVK